MVDKRPHVCNMLKKPFNKSNVFLLQMFQRFFFLKIRLTLDIIPPVGLGG